MLIHEHTAWPELVWDQAKVMGQLSDVRHLQGRLLGRMGSLGFPLRAEASMQTLTQDVVNTSKIEGEKLDEGSVRSSIAEKMGLEVAGASPADRHIDGIVEVMLDATGNYDAPLSHERLFGWHAALFPTGRSGMRRITVGGWRTGESGPMQVVSGTVGQETIHLEAPGHDRLKREMQTFTSWFNRPTETDLVIKSAVAHFRFVTVHPFDDGNGRIARALADMLLARSDRSAQRFYSMSSQIQRERRAYYDVLEACQKGSLDISAWMDWYLNCLKRAIETSGMMLETVMAKAAFWQQHVGEELNARQRVMLNRLLDGSRVSSRLPSGQR